MPSIKVPTEVVDMQTGEVTERKTTAMHLMPPSDPLACQECGRRHEPEQPHDAEKMHYQYHFYAEHGRWPTWKDAVAHCPEPIRQAWEAALREEGAWPKGEPT